MTGEATFDQLFLRSGFSGARHDDNGSRWDFSSPDLNESARALFRHVDSVIQALGLSDYTFLASIELDVEAGRFPDLLVQYFRDVIGADDRPFFIAPVRHIPGEGSRVGRLTFAAQSGDLACILRHDAGIRWGSALRVWGLQVDQEHVRDLVALTPFDARERAILARRSRAAWIASDDLDALALWLSSAVSSVERRRIEQLG